MSKSPYHQMRKARWYSLMGEQEQELQPFYRALGSRLQRARVERGESQEALGAVMGGVTFQQVQKYERGENRVPLDKLVKAAAYLNVDFLWLVFGDEVPAGEEVKEILDVHHSRDLRRVGDAVSRIHNAAVRKIIIEYAESAAALDEEVPQAG